MMTRMSAVGPEAFSRRERLSSGLTNMMRDGKLASSAGGGGISRREKLLGMSPPMISPLSMSSDQDELREEDIWGNDENADDSSEKQHKREDHRSNPPAPLGISAMNRSAGTRSRMIPQVYGAPPPPIVQSAPVNIPDWSKITRCNNKENGFDLGVDFDDFGDEDEEDHVLAGGNKLPPHELVAREYARSHTAFSVYEGAGRTLKGRDLSRVRNAIWKQTGFLGG